ECQGAYRSLAADGRSLAMFFGLTFGEQMLPIVNTWLVARGMGINVGALYFAATLPLALLIARLPISIDGIGVFEGVFVVLMSLAGLSAAQAVAIAVASRILGPFTADSQRAALKLPREGSARVLCHGNVLEHEGKTRSKVPVT